MYVVALPCFCHMRVFVPHVGTHLPKWFRLLPNYFMVVVDRRYDCRSCGAAFQRYYELIKHQRSHAGCSVLATLTSTSKHHLSQHPPPDKRRPDVCTTQLRRYDKQLTGTPASAATSSPSSYRQQYNHHRRHHEPWRYRAPPPPPSMAEGHAHHGVAAVGPSGQEVVTAQALQHAAGALPVPVAVPPVFAFPPPHHLPSPLLTSSSWKNGSTTPGSCNDEVMTTFTGSGSASSGVDLTSGNRRQTDSPENQHKYCTRPSDTGKENHEGTAVTCLSSIAREAAGQRRQTDPVETKCERLNLDDRASSLEEFAAKPAIVTVDGEDQNGAVRLDEDDRKPSQQNLAEAAATFSQLHYRTMASIG